MRFKDEPVLVLLGELARGADHLVDQRRKLHRPRVELKLAGLDLGEVEHLVDEAEQVGAGGIYSAQRLLRLLRAETRRVGTIISVSPMMALSGVRSSWLMLERNCDLCWLANFSWRLFSWIS